MYKYFDNDRITPFDVDSTLIFWGDNYHQFDENKVHVICPYTGDNYYFEPIDRHIDLIRQMKGRGDLVIVWSASGGPWAKAVIDALGLKDNVDLIFGKFQDYVDDISVGEWAGKRVYLVKNKDNP